MSEREEYTPDTGTVRAVYTRARRQAFIASTSEHIEEFNRWLASHDRELREQIAQEIEAKREEMVEAAIAVTGRLPTWLDPYTEGMDDALAAVRGEDQTDE